MVLDFRNRVALVTGGTRGIGKTVCETLHAAGAIVYATGTRKDVVDTLNSSAPEGVHYMCVDFCNDESVQIFLSEVSKLPRIDICVNNAGINIINSFDEADFDEFMKVQTVNIFGPRRLLGVVIPKMKEHHYGRIVNIGSIWSVINRPGRTSYAVSKNAIVGMTKSLAVEVAADNIMVNAVSPGFTLTELTMQTNTPEQIVTLGKAVPARRMAHPQEQANVIAFLCSEQNSYMTGQNLIVDGGYTNV